MTLFEKAVLLTLALIGLVLGWAVFAEAQTDQRSLYHFSASAAIGAVTNSIVLANQPVEQDKWLRRGFVFGACLGVGGVKEYILDDEADTDDMLWNAAGCFASIAVTDGLWLSFSEDSIAVNGRF